VGLDTLTLNASRKRVREKLNFNKLKKERGRDNDIIERSEKEGF